MKKIVWSKDRPVKPDSDPLLADLRKQLQKDNRSTFLKADRSGLSPSTIHNIESGKTRRPQAVTLQMLGAAMGLKLKFVGEDE